MAGLLMGHTAFKVILVAAAAGLYPFINCDHLRKQKMLRGISKTVVHTFWIFMLLAFVPSVTAPNPNQQKDYDVLPGMKRWNGIPFHDFATTWWIALGVALGSIAQDGWTLLQTANSQDAGAPGQGGNAQQQQQSTNRNVRLFNCILKLH